MPADELVRLLHGEMEVLGRMPYSSNATFLVEVGPRDNRLRAIYKPVRGERPLWDYPDGLYKREVAAYLLADAVGWDLIPETVVRDGAAGEGSVQRFIETDYDDHFFTLRDDERYWPQLRRMALFDLLANSCDRKGGHVLVDESHHLWGIDNGLTFHQQFKLRTVIWDFGGEAMPEAELEAVERFFEAGIPDDLAALLDPFERDALLGRCRAVLSEGRFPIDPTGRAIPWPVL